MDELKLNRWKKRFENEVSTIEVEYHSFFMNRNLSKFYTIERNESGEWELKLNEALPSEIKARFQQIFLTTKPEDSI